MTINNKTKNFISVLLIISIILPSILLSAPKKANAAGIPVLDVTNYVPNWMQQVWGGLTSTATQLSAYFETHKFANWILQNVLKRIAKAFLAKMTQATINWINSDFHGSPLFLENPESFFRDIAKSELRNLVDMIGYDTFRFPFGKQTALNVINSYKRQLADNAQYTLSRVINDPDLLVRYRNDFNYGGWNGFLINTQYPQNNYLGFQMIIQQNLASRLQGTLQAPAQKIQSLLQQGMGFLSPQSCPSNPKYNNGVNEFLRPTWKDSGYDKAHPFDPNTGASGSLKWSEEKAKAKAAFYDPNGPNVCPGGLVNTTPGSVAANQISTALNMPFLTTALDGALGNSLAAIFDALINHFLSKGLNALSSTVNPTPSGDNWSYDGNTLGGSTTPYGTPTSLNIPQNVSASVDQVTSTNISGGTAPYSIQTKPNAGIATAKIDFTGSGNPTLTITGVAPGQTFVVVKDSSAPSKTVAVQITINAIGAFAVVPRNILANINNPIIATISGGERPYSVQIGPNEAVAIVVFSDTNLVITGTAPGQTFVVVKDSSIPPRTITVPITILGPGTLIIPQNISVNVGQVTNTTISGGTAPYSIERDIDSAVATAKISGATLTITGVISGQTAIIVKDSSSPAKITSVNIVVN